jgi:hypothetical protein
MPFLPFSTVDSRVFWVVHRALIPLALGITILSRMFAPQKHEPARWSWPEWFMGFFLTIGAISIIITRQQPLLYLYELYDRMFVPFCAYWLIRYANLKEKDLRRWLPIMLIVCIAEIVIGFWARYAPDTLPTIWDIPRMGNRMSGTFENPTPYAYTLMFCMLFIFHYAMQLKRGITQTFLIFTFALGLLCIFLTFTRGCWGAALLALLGLLYIYPKPVLTLLAVAIPVFVILAVGPLADEMATAFIRLNTQDTVDSRLVLSHAGQQMFYTKPIFGWGFGNYDRYDWQFMQPVGGAAPTSWDLHYGTSHNTYLTVLAEMGMVGFILQFFPLFWWLGLAPKALPHMPRQDFWSWRLLIVLWLAILFYLAASQVVDKRFFWYQIGLWWLSLGLIGHLVEVHLKPREAILLK